MLLGSPLNNVVPSGRIVGIGIGLPETVVTNHDLSLRLDTTDDWIVSRTGIRERHIGETSSALGVDAARMALEDSGLGPDDIELLIFSTSTPDRRTPPTAALVQDRLGLRCGAFDVNAACAGFVYGLVLAHGQLALGAERVLVVSGETPSRMVDPDDRTVAVLAGDGGGAAVIEAASGDSTLLGWDLGCDGTASEILTCEHGGYLHMNGQEVFRRAVRASVESAEAALKRAAVAAADIDLFVPHQANLRIIEKTCRLLGIGIDRAAIVLDRYGNTSSSSVPLALHDAVGRGAVREGDLVLLSGFGAGMTWASAVVRWHAARGDLRQEAGDG